MNDLLLFIYLVFLFFEIILLFLYNASYVLTLIFLPFFFFKREKKRKKREFFERDFLERDFLEREFKREFETNLKNKKIYFYYWIFIMLKAVSVCGFMYTLINLTDLFLKNTGFSAPTNSQINDFAVLFLLLLVSEFWRTTILEMSFYSFYSKHLKYLKKCFFEINAFDVLKKLLKQMFLMS